MREEEGVAVNQITRNFISEMETYTYTLKN